MLLPNFIKDFLKENNLSSKELKISNSYILDD